METIENNQYNEDNEDVEMRLFQNLEHIEDILKKQDELSSNQAEILKTIIQLKNKISDPDLYRSLIKNVSFAIYNTKCRLPDSKDLCEYIAKDLMPILDVRINQCLHDVSVMIAGNHKVTYGYLLTKADKVTKNWIKGLTSAVIFLFLLVVTYHVWWFNSNAYWNERYADALMTCRLSKQEYDKVNAVAPLSLTYDLRFPMSICRLERQKNIKMIEQMIANKVGNDKSQ